MSTPIEQVVRTIVAELAELDASELAPDTTLRESGIDSLLAMEIAVHVENAVGVRFEDDDLREVRTIADLVDVTVRRGG